MMGFRNVAEAVEAQRPVQLLDGTPARFAAIFKATLDLPVRRMLIVKANKPHEVPCIMCDEEGSEYTILLSMGAEDDDGEYYEQELVWPVHQKHFESSVTDEEDLHGT